VTMAIFENEPIKPSELSHKMLHNTSGGIHMSQSQIRTWLAPDYSANRA
jgi:hypothetical protein